MSHLSLLLLQALLEALPERPDHAVGPGSDEQIEHALSLGAEDQLAIGADFFHDADWATALQKSGKPYGFFDEMKDSSCYPQLLNFLSDHFPPALLEKISHQNALSFIQMKTRSSQITQD